MFGNGTKMKRARNCSDTSGIIFGRSTIFVDQAAFKNALSEIPLNIIDVWWTLPKRLAQLQHIDMEKGVLTIQNSLQFFKIGIESCRKHKNYVALDCGLGDRDPKYPRGVPWDQNFWSKIFLISSSNDLILWVLWIGYAKNAKNQEKLPILA